MVAGGHVAVSFPINVHPRLCRYCPGCSSTISPTPSNGVGNGPLIGPMNGRGIVSLPTVSTKVTRHQSMKQYRPIIVNRRTAASDVSIFKCGSAQGKRGQPSEGRREGCGRGFGFTTVLGVPLGLSCSLAWPWVACLGTARHSGRCRPKTGIEFHVRDLKITAQSARCRGFSNRDSCSCLGD